MTGFSQLPAGCSHKLSLQRTLGPSPEPPLPTSCLPSGTGASPHQASRAEMSCLPWGRPLSTCRTQCGQSLWDTGLENRGPCQLRNWIKWRGSRPRAYASRHPAESWPGPYRASIWTWPQRSLAVISYVPLSLPPPFFTPDLNALSCFQSTFTSTTASDSHSTLQRTSDQRCQEDLSKVRSLHM